MTTLYVVLALAAGYIAYSIYDARRDDAIHQMNDFYEVEYKKSFVVQNESVIMGKM
ncbi:MAG: hypothetical protein IKB82_01280 [Clostridia bacterium]|nr:hypothetical protein [Clostridia bacterium]